ncbi:hypothetical protein ACFQFQ_01370 [Sulfitobacter porphyrae]|uniref:Uncharacterized protein n=1 Tax=Sulfitobacter porphyrae TaxID=1246864 RepID=A0ABW2AYU3_9RHOB
MIAQSLQFGTSLTVALKTYAIEMRQMRELAAQEKANKLPVQMSGVMSVLMLLGAVSDHPDTNHHPLHGDLLIVQYRPSMAGSLSGKNPISSRRGR